MRYENLKGGCSSCGGGGGNPFMAGLGDIIDSLIDVLFQYGQTGDITITDGIRSYFKNNVTCTPDITDAQWDALIHEALLSKNLSEWIAVTANYYTTGDTSAIEYLEDEVMDLACDTAYIEELKATTGGGNGGNDDDDKSKPDEEKSFLEKYGMWIAIGVVGYIVLK